MTIKEFSQKHSLVFFWATIVLAILLLSTVCMGGRNRYNMMNNGYNYGKNDRGMMNNRGGYQQRQFAPGRIGQPLINNTGTTTTIEAEAQIVPVQAR